MKTKVLSTCQPSEVDETQHQQPDRTLILLSKAHQVKKLSFRQQAARFYIQELSEEIKSTQRAIAGLQKTSVIIMDKLDFILQERKPKKYIEAGYR